MTQYLLSVRTGQGEPGEPMTEDQVRELTERVLALQDEMRAAGAWVFGGRLHAPDTATVVRMADGEVLTTDGPFAETKDHLGGFYVIDAPDLDAALSWAGRVTALIGAPIEVRPFVAELGT